MFPSWPMWTHSSHPALHLLQSCSSLTRLMLRWGKDKVFPMTGAASQDKQSKNIISAPLFSPPNIPLPLLRWAMAVQTAVMTIASSVGWCHCKKIYSSLLLQDQGDVTRQIDNNEWDHITHSLLSISSAHCHCMLWAESLEESQPHLHNTKL